MRRTITSKFFLGNLGNPQSTKEILLSIPLGIQLGEGMMTDHKGYSGVDETRKCLSASLEAEGSISIGMERILCGCNDMAWSMPLDNQWVVPLMYLEYKRQGDFIDWHVDADDTDNSPRLSLSYMLSHAEDYEGGEFCIEDKELKLDYGDFIVFPSDVSHAVKEVTGGVRKVLVGWYR